MDVSCHWIEPFYLSEGSHLVIGVYVDIQFYAVDYDIEVVSNHFAVIVLLVFLAVITKTRIRDF